MVLIIRRDEVGQVLRMADVIRASREAYLEVDRGRAANRPRTFTIAHTASGRFSSNTMEGALADQGVYSLRIAATTSSEGPDQSRSGGTERGSFHHLYDLKTGRLLAIIQDGPIGSMRVQAINAVAASHMARPDTRRMALIGSGYQATAAIEAMRSVRPIEEVRVYSKTPEHRKSFVLEMQKRHGDVDIREAQSAEEAVRGADMVVCATNSRAPVVKGEWVEPGMHLTGVLPLEFDLEAYRRADYIVIYNRLHGRDYTLNRGPEEVPLEPPAHAPYLKDAPEITDLVSGKVPGRHHAQEVTMFANGGHGWGLDGGPGYPVQLTAMAKLVYDLARERGLGEEIDL